ncbi:Helix-turn-helix domain-containing protein [Marisediminitalea aggregata]|jgi:transcriptional regulator with XRE-family HTH domain|uniref:Helix-turn-helix domain-containing protein n=1 Tax=Marisediminitalea aggregata TaxID=634436 RepID=A0A1M5EWM1_9ALTE|nr:helix-turn-helix transcriptional regulator [Marisediminitalea aggregata]MBL53464.1 XRE family transcriptional regulator [Alteromonadaceae bacterium]MCP3865954.1 helix-turn-helix transcriptional regulator [Aestuariibacter sp.]MEC7822897.1 helix-turn-helix transcriptional regulator [Pseudomonadota bacterium]MCP4236660.1 helix-turn-helix transcriptional regulator [Aestuariibacter sp.]MCP4529396.1 helix-turn-helix transcriptional regulator [Aestuariibacter sp.]|tara:strand:+ start:236 stop:487 length:252 start_codon:yes stop_codon:yes gene_type:complete
MSREGIGQQLQAERKRQKLSQSDIADKLQCSRPSISNIENGRYQGSLQLLERYLNIMGFELTATPKQAKRPTLDELDSVYNDD